MELSRAVDAFLADLELSRSGSTVVAYRYALGRFAEFLQARGALPADVAGLSIDQAVAFARWLLAVPGSSHKTVEVYVAAVSVFLGYLLREEIRPDLPLERLRLRLRPLLARRPATLPRVPADAAVAGLLAAAAAARGTDGRAPGRAELLRLRDVALVETLLGTGLRVSELVSLRRAALANGDRSAVVTGKGGKERLFFFSPAAAEAIAAYLAARGDGPPAEPLFCRHDQRAGTPPRPRPLTRRGVWYVLRSLGRAAGVVDGGLTPHRLRAYFATRVLGQTGDLAATQDLLGHASPQTTRRYARLADRRLREQHGRAFPVPPAELAPAAAAPLRAHG